MTDSPMDSYFEKVVSLIKENGWMVQHVFDQPFYSYTVGLSITHGLPEVLLLGMEQRVAQQILNNVARQLVEGMELEEGRDYDKVFRGLPARFRHLTDAQVEQALRVASELRPTKAVPEAWQLLWPDRNGVLPGQPSVDATTEAIQSLSLLEVGSTGKAH